MTKIACLIRPEPPLIYFVNRIHEEYPIALVVVESPSLKSRFTEKMKQHGISEFLDVCMNRLLKSMKRGDYIRDCNKYFGDKWKRIDGDIPILNVENINSPVVQERMKEERPDVILDHGTSIVKDSVLESSHLALNLHWGLSPYYRGTNCTEWALLNWDPHNIGVTIHKLTKIVDGGSIFAQKRAVIEPGETAHSINMQLTKLGTELVLKAIEKIESGEELQFKRQDYSLGFLTRNKQWSKHFRRQIRHIERNELIELMLKTPARKQKLPIEEL